MCGIAGTFHFDDRPADAGLLRVMIAALRHRGPDAAAIWTSGSVGLAHARLSIIDLAGGAQPMVDADDDLAISYNGEIFNYVELRKELVARGYRFRTQSDTEVILKMYAELGERCVERFNGQWAFAIWDARRKMLFLSRDRLGVRPLFYRETSDGFLFASELKSILACPGVPRTIDLKALDQVFTFWSMLPPRTMLEGIQQLPPGHSMRVTRAGTRVQRYWQLDYSTADAQLDEAHAAEQVLELLEDATRLRLRADVPVGAYLSGGLDSSIIAALVRKQSGEMLETFSVSFDDSAFDESRFQREVVDLLGTRHRTIRCTYNDICAAFSKVVWHAETPILRTAPAPLYALSGLVRERGYKVVLTGEGADEFFGGYDIFKEAKVRRFIGAHPGSQWRPLLLKRLYPYLTTVQVLSAAYLQAFFHVDSEDLSNRFYSHLPRWRLTSKLKGFFSADTRAALRDADAFADLDAALPPDFDRWDALSQAQYLEATALLPGYLLSSQGDRMAMAHSVEGRFPYLDARLVSLSTRIPPRLRMKVLNEKYLLKRAAGHLVPSAVRSRSKQPYRAPDAASFFDPATGKARATYVDEMLSASHLDRTGLFDTPAVGMLIQKARNGRTIGVRDNMALVGILSTQLFASQFVHDQEGIPA